MEVAGHKVFNTPYANVCSLARELASVPNPTKEQQRFKVVSESAALQLNDRNLASIANPPRGASAQAEP